MKNVITVTEKVVLLVVYILVHKTMMPVQNQELDLKKNEWTGNLLILQCYIWKAKFLIMNIFFLNLIELNVYNQFFHYRNNHTNKGKQQRDRRKLREKRRSTGVVHLPSTEVMFMCLKKNRQNRLGSIPHNNIYFFSK